MPTYQYACTECGHRFEAVQSFSDDALTECPQCTGRLRKVFNSVGIVFKGSGFYRTDSRDKPKESASSTDAAAKTDQSTKSDAAATSGSSNGSSASSGSSGSSTSSSPSGSSGTGSSSSSSSSTPARSSSKAGSAA